MPKLDDYVLFAHVVRHGGFAPAERATGIAKTRLSKRVAALERALACRLLERSTRSFRVTDIGLEVYHRSEAILANADQAYTAAAHSLGKVTGGIRVAWPLGLAKSFASQALVRFMETYPDVRVDLQIADGPLNLIDDGIDLALRIGSGARTEESLVVRTLGTTPTRLVGAPALIARDAPSIVAHLGRFATLAGIGPDHRRWTLVGPDGKRESFDHTPKLVCADAETVRDAAIAGLGIALLPEPLCVAELRRGTLVQMLPAWQGVEQKIELLFTTRRGMLPSVRALIDHLAGSFACSGFRHRALPQNTSITHIVGF
ncbi:MULTISPECIES: LysR family transcriptional regulator [Sphingomonadaceae]|uniref:LysR family transcriptional regulator n=1 Tax=Sphingobium fluviale TaxID=2506423 RepID=A0A4Q1KDL5_9SPHN|nr:MULTISPECIES: LysR family transcriptional regulator [Sphingomonadaceae]RXR25168.1 LysR family transcriptional regulator [Sphingobium fluviale]